MSPCLLCALAMCTAFARHNLAINQEDGKMCFSSFLVHESHCLPFLPAPRFLQNDRSMGEMQIIGGEDLSTLTGKVC